MRQVIEQQMELGQTPIDKIDIDVNSRDDIPATLLLSLIHISEPTRPY